MPKAKHPITFSDYYDIPSKALKRLGVLDPVLGIDTKLFIDPLLLAHCQYQEISLFGVKLYKEYFEKIIKLLSVSQRIEDVPWRNARRLLEFHEIKGTCLGYGAGSISGSAFGKKLTNRILHVAKEIVELGIRDPDLFPLLGLLEEDIGPDRISDMVTNVILPALMEFNSHILQQLGIKGSDFKFGSQKGKFVENPFESYRTPVIFVPTDILRKLPVAQDWDQVADVAQKNQELRDRVNAYIAHIWAQKTKREKEKLKVQALASDDAFSTLLRIIHSVAPTPYNAEKDPDGILSWAPLAHDYTVSYPLKIGKKALTLDGVYDIVRRIIEQFRHLVENCGLNKELYREDLNPKHESTAQRLFFAISYCYCKANDLDISPEIDTGTGKIDFKFSAGFKSRVLVEVKLSTNNQLISGYQSQLEIYKKSQETMRAFYLVIDVGRLGKKDETLYKIKNAAAEKGDPLSEIEVVDGEIKPSASKRHASRS